ncbi:Bacterial alpha-L-rhamnosidase [compost metagenome]
MNSYNHYAYGSVGDWLYRAVAGLDMDESKPAYQRIWFRPRPDSNLDYAKAAYKSVYGTIRSEWSKADNGSICYEFELPPNTTATAVLRGIQIDRISVNGQPVSVAEGVIGAHEQEGVLELKLGSGIYRITE